jgi:hypothetical protein
MSIMHFYIYKAVYCTMLESPFKLTWKMLPACTSLPARNEILINLASLKLQMGRTSWVAC